MKIPFDIKSIDHWISFVGDHVPMKHDSMDTFLYRNRETITITKQFDEYEVTFYSSIRVTEKNIISISKNGEEVSTISFRVDKFTDIADSIEDIDDRRFIAHDIVGVGGFLHTSFANINHMHDLEITNEDALPEFIFKVASILK